MTTRNKNRTTDAEMTLPAMRSTSLQLKVYHHGGDYPLKIGIIIRSQVGHSQHWIERADISASFPPLVISLVSNFGPSLITIKQVVYVGQVLMSNLIISEIITSNFTSRFAPKCTEIWSEKVPEFSPLWGQAGTYFGAKLASLVSYDFRFRLLRQRRKLKDRGLYSG